MHHDQMIAMKTGANPLHRPPAPVDSQTEQEDPYGRCTNMRLTSFTDKGTAGGQGTTGVPRDPRLIDLSQSSAVSTGNLGHVPPQNLSNGGGGGNWGGPPPPQSQSQNVSNFNTLPAHMTQQHQVRASNIFQHKLNIFVLISRPMCRVVRCRVIILTTHFPPESETILREICISRTTCSRADATLNRLITGRSTRWRRSRRIRTSNRRAPTGTAMAMSRLARWCPAMASVCHQTTPTLSITTHISLTCLQNFATQTTATTSHI